MASPVVFFEVTGRDGAGLRRFYGELFGWEFGESGDPTYGVVAAQDGGIAGGIGDTRDGSTGATLFYVDVNDLDDTLTRAERLGGRTIVGPSNVPGGITIAVIADPEGHVVGVSTSAVRR